MTQQPSLAALPEYELFAILYAERQSTRASNFIGGDPHDGPMALAYYIWVARSETETIVFDIGFNKEVAGKRGRTFLRCPAETLGELGIDAKTVRTVVLTHLHYDHVGNLEKFPAAHFHLQEPEIHFAVGRHIRHRHIAHSFEVEDIVQLVRANYRGRLSLHTGPVDLRPGIRLHPAPGHSACIQFATVNTRRGIVVLASDVSHFYENMMTGRPFTIALDLPATLAGYDKLRAAAPLPMEDYVVPGHDPLVMARYPAVRPDLEGVIVRLDTPPKPAG